MRFEDYPIHDSIRGHFGRALYFAMRDNPDIWLVCADLGYGLFDHHKADFSDRFINTGAAEQSAVGIAVGLALSGKIPFVYSITTFLLYRSFEWHRNYLNHEKIPVRLIGSGYEDDYKHDGVTHQPYNLFGMEGLFETQLPDIDTYFPQTKEEIPTALENMITANRPSFLCLKR